jgi:hypothetical protein
VRRPNRTPKPLFHARQGQQETQLRRPEIDCEETRRCVAKLVLILYCQVLHENLLERLSETTLVSDQAVLQFVVLVMVRCFDLERLAVLREVWNARQYRRC